MLLLFECKGRVLCVSTRWFRSRERRNIRTDFTVRTSIAVLAVADVLVDEIFTLGAVLTRVGRALKNLLFTLVPGVAGNTQAPATSDAISNYTTM